MTEPRSGRTVLLDARAAVRCPVALDHSISGTEQDAASDVVLKWRDAANAHRRIVLDRVRAGLTPFVEITESDSAAARAATSAAIGDGAPIILSPRLRDDLDGGRRGRADLLIEGSGGYLPVLIKRHRIAEVATNGRARSSSLERPTLDAAVIVHGRRLGKAARDDAMELAHLRRLMDATAIPGPPLGGLVDAEGVLWWVELDAPRGGGAGSPSAKGWLLEQSSDGVTLRFLLWSCHSTRPSAHAAASNSSATARWRPATRSPLSPACSGATRSSTERRGGGPDSPSRSSTRLPQPLATRSRVTMWRCPSVT